MTRRRSKNSKSSGSNSFNSPSAPGTFSFRLESNNSIIPSGSNNPVISPLDPFLRISNLEYQLSLHIQEINQLRISKLSSDQVIITLCQVVNDLRTQVAELKHQIEVQQVSGTILSEEFLSNGNS
ncbi:24863_t:CDS:1 [Gigaspora margarita]|uniref:24863_t:CDS:1 n=1 Tax=Gigaspora margarita TaxID=4874 RepID=A0ABN7WY99_GIGMA|nr:24863_t:CDS:1 [Gigaspora margarita]